MPTGSGARREHLLVSRGFTLIELTLVVAIIATLSAIAIPSYMGFIEKARVVRATAEIRGFSTSIDVYEAENRTPPTSLADVGEAGAVDPWGRPYAYLKIAGSTPFTDAAPPHPRFARVFGPPRVILAAAPQSPPGPPSAPGGGGPPSDPNVMGQARKDRFLVPLNSDYDLYSNGKDGDSKPPLNAKESHDDVVRANNGAYIGLASQY